MRIGLKHMALAAGFAVAGCTTTPGVDVTRFHLNQPIPADSIELQAPPGIDGNSLEFRSQAAIVAADLATHGLTVPARPGISGYIGVMRAEQTSQVGQAKPSPFSIGIGGFTGGSGGGVGGGVQVPVGGARNNLIRVNSLALQIRRRSENTMIWEGRAIEELPSGAEAGVTAALPRLSRALLKDFPGPSGQTVRVTPTR